MTDPGYVHLDKMIGFLRELGDKVIEKARPEVAKTMRSEVERTIRAQTDAYGEPWKPGAEGEPVLEGTPITAKIRGPKITIRIEGHHALHHRGHSKGGVRRAILPINGLLPPAMARAIKRTLEKRFEQAKGAL